MSDTTEIVKNVAGAADKLADLLHKLAGPMAEEVGLLWGDKVRAYRQRNLASIIGKAQGVLNNAAVEAKPVPPRVLLPLLEASSLENSEELQDWWANLLASASEEGDLLPPSFAEVLSSLRLQKQGISNTSIQNSLSSTGVS